MERVQGLGAFMTYVYSGNGLGDFYFALVRDITENGRKVNVRGHDCLELPGLVVLEYQRCGYCWMRIPGRKWNPFLALAEIPWILSGNGNVDWISYFGSNMKSFQDGNNPDLHGAYGLRIRKWPEKIVVEGEVDYTHIDQIDYTVKKLRADPNSRQAVISLWDPIRDNEYSRDIPCNNTVTYTLRNGVLAQTVTIRSNDLVWGTPYNAVQFTHLHAYMAGLLGVKMGLFTYVIHNLHYYMDLYKPTLANLIEQAYKGEELEAECLTGFDTFGDFGLNCLKRDVEISFLEHYHDANKVRGEVFGAQLLPGEIPSRQNWLGYTKEIADALKLFIKVKSGFGLTTGTFDYLADLKQPLRDLIIDFYESSKNPSAQLVVDFLRRKNDVTA